MLSAFKKIFILLIVFFTVFSVLLFPIKPIRVQAQSSTNLSEDLKKAEERLKELRKQQEELNRQILKEQQNQTSLAQQTKSIDRNILRNELQIEALELELQKLTLEVQILNEEQKKLVLRLSEVQDQLVQKQIELKSTLNLLYKMSLNSASFLEANIDFQQSAISQEKERSTIRLIKADLQEVQKLQDEVIAKKKEIDEKQKSAIELQSQVMARNDNLSNQQNALKWQKENKQKLLELSQSNQETLKDRKDENDQTIKNIEAERVRIMAALTNLPPSNTLVQAGQVIGFQGRSGLSCSIYDSSLSPVRTNDYCQRYAGLSSQWYYYEPDKFPSKGSHLHFVYTVGGKQVNTDEYIRGSKKDQLTVMPMSPFTVTQGWHGGGAVDMASYHGAPIYAVRKGFVSYHCSNWPNVPGFPDPLFGAVIHHVDADGKPDGTTSGYWHLQRKGYPCK